MKILLLTTHMDTGGISVYVASLARGLKEQGHAPQVVSAGGWLERRLAKEGIPHRTVSSQTSSELNPRLWLEVFPRLIQLIRTEQPDILHAHTRVMQVLAWACSKVTGVPFVTTCHGLYRFRIGRRYFRCWGRSVMAISGASMHRLVKQYTLAPPHQVTLVVNGVEVDRLSQPVPEEEIRWFRQVNGLTGEPIIGAIARLSPVKGLDIFLRAVPPLLKDFPKLQVLLVGDGSAREDLVRLAYELKVAEHVVISHSVEDTRIPMALMKVCVSAAFREGFGLSIVEAMAAGLPVVVTDAGGPTEIVDQGRCGLLVPPGDPKAIERAVRRLLTDETLYRQMVERGKERARNFYDMKRVVQEVEVVYEDALSGKKRR